MRQIGTIAELRAAQRLQDYLIAQGTTCSLDESDAGYGVWIHDDDYVPAAKVVLEHFLAHPDDERYLTARAKADALLREQAAQRKAARQNTVAMSRRWEQRGGGDLPLTVGMVLVCLMVFVDTEFMADERGFRELFFFSKDGTWNAILKDNEWWRLLSPSILHFGPMHILFNMIGWWQLAGMIEQRKGTLYLLLLMLSTALTTDVLQFSCASPWFGGMSGVVYGLFAYAWVKGKLDPGDGIGVNPAAAVNYLVFYLLCWIGAFGRVANYGHAGGLLMGITVGCLSAWWRNRRRAN